MHNLTPCLWFDSDAEEAAGYYVAIFQNSKLGQISRYGAGAPLPEGTALTVSFTLDGREFLALNGGPYFKFNEAVSFVVYCENQAEIDEKWEKLGAGGQYSQCGWLKDKYGLSWQIVPRVLSRLMDSKDPARANRVMQALLQMRKLDLAKLLATAKADS